MKNRPFTYTQLQRANEILQAVKLIGLGARQQLVLSISDTISENRLSWLYKETCGNSPPKGLLPFAEKWFLTWQPNIHSSLFMSYYQFFKVQTTMSPVELLIKSYEAYLKEVSRHANYDEKKPILSITRAWSLLRLMGPMRMLKMTPCTSCGGNFVTRTDESRGFYKVFKCGFCKKPARAGITKGMEKRP